MKKINILGSEWTIKYRKAEDDAKLTGIDGYCDSSVKLIVVEDMQPDENSKSCLENYKKQVLRHEIIHAFLFESGLEASTFESRAWAQNEEMVDWIAIQFPKLKKAFEEADCG